jgi:SAM-dependent methyltransferase
LELKPGDKVLDVGCGTGRNLRRLVEAVGPTGEIFGVDCCEGMLAKAKELSKRHQWHNVKLWQQDAAELILPTPVDGVLFSLSYSVIPKPLNALTKAWEYLRALRRIVILDGKPAHGLLGGLSRPFVTFVSRSTVLGSLDRQPWKDLKTLTPLVEMEEVNYFGTYYICRGTKPETLDSVTEFSRFLSARHEPTN